MSSGWRPVDGDEIIVNPESPSPSADTHDDIHAAEASGSPVATGTDTDLDDDPAPRRRGRITDNRMLLLGAILVVVVAQLVVGFLALSSINDLRDQSASSNGLQHCLITAQLKQATSSNAAAYQSAVQACVSR